MFDRVVPSEHLFTLIQCNLCEVRTFEKAYKWLLRTGACLIWVKYHNLSFKGFRKLAF